MTVAAPAEASTAAEPALDGAAQAETARPALARLLLHRVATGARFGVASGVGIWLADVCVLAATRGPIPWKRWCDGVGAALFVVVTVAAVAGGALGPLVVPIARDLTLRTQQRLRELRAHDREAGPLLAAQSLAATLQVLLWSFAAYRATLRAEFGLARQESIAAVLALLCFGYAATFVIAWPWTVRIALSLVDPIWRVRASAGPSRRAWIVPSALTWLATVSFAELLLHYRAELSTLPWHEALAIPGVALACAAAAVLPRLRPIFGVRPAHVALALLAFFVTAGTRAALRLRPESTTARNLAFQRAVSGRIGYAAWSAAFDFDGDGQLSMLGGGDCAPFDATRYTGAVEIPGNGIDEDCDGEDLPKTPIRPRARMMVGQQALPAKPTIVLITIDALAAPRLSALGSPEPLMPNVDRLASQGMLFTHCFSQGPSTRLSFPSMFTSRWDSQMTQVFSTHFPYSLAPGEGQVQDMLDGAGYQTAAVLPSSYFAPDRWQSVTRGFQQVDVSAIPFGKNNAPQVTDAALRVLSQTSDRPRYLWIHYYDAHGPYQPVPGVAYARRDEESYYKAELTYVDREIGRLLAALDARPEPVYVMLSADHATVFHPNPASRHAHYGYDLYTATLHVPLIVRGPGIAPGRAEGIVSTMDIAPTIAELAHLPDSPRFEGTSLMPELLAHKSDDARTLFHEFYLGERLFKGDEPLEQVSVRDARYDLVLDRVHGSYELYDWPHDYYEQRNVYEDAGGDPDAKHLRSLLSAFVQQFHKRPATAKPATRLAGTGEAEHDEP